jgi:hypothetical protein
MKSKTIIRTLFLAFVVVSAAAFISKELRRHPEAHPGAADPALAPSASAGATSPDRLPDPAHQVVAYYFHGRYRCPSCLKIEAYTREAIQSGFAEELKNRSLEWREINVEEAGNQHFVQDYQLYTKSVILSDLHQGRQTRWKNLDQVWTFLPDKSAFMNYVTAEVRGYLVVDR